MPASAPRKFAFVCGSDDFIVGRLGKARFDELSKQATDEFSREIVPGFAANVDEVAVAVNRFREAVLTIPLFGGRRVVWLKDVNFLADSVTGKAESTLSRVEDLQAVLEAVNPEETAVVVTAAPVDRRRSFIKWCEKNADFVLADAGEDADSLASVVLAEAQALGATLAPGAVELLLARIGANARMLTEEVHKLAAHSSDGKRIDAEDVAALTPNVAQGDFFEASEAFFSGNLNRTLDALRRHFFEGGDIRPLLASLQNRNRILIQLRALIDADSASVGPRGVDGLARASQSFGSQFGDALSEKSTYNVFSQNPWYVGKLAGAGRLPPLRRLIDNQRAFVEAFDEVIRRPDAQPEVMQNLVVRCLAAW